MISIFNEEDINNIIKKLNIKFDKFTKDDFITGINIELEHGTINKVTNVTDNDLEKTSKIALAHLNEFPNYYNKEYGLLKFEEYLKTKKQTNK